MIVTGGSSGIGRSFISVIGEAKPDVRLCNLSRTVPGIFADGFTPRHIPCDLGDPAQRARGLDDAERFIEQGGDRSPILLINNAGIGSYGFFPSDDSGRDAAIVSLNVGAVVEVSARLMPHMIARGGAILNIASIASFQATPFAATYGASKAFLLNWSVAVREELRPRGIPVVAVCPGPVRTPFFTSAGLDGTQADGSLGLDADQVVRCALKGLARDRAIVVPGMRNKFIRAASALVPRTWAAHVSKRVLASQRAGLG